ncbi:MAG: hypothetical protein ACP5R2_13900 [Anaerolineae bacterium]
MKQPTITTQGKRFGVVAGLLVCMGLLLMLLPGAGALPPAQAQEPDVSASAITQNVSANVSISHYPAVSGTQTFTYTRNVTPSITVRVSCWGGFYINVAVSLSGNVPLTVVYIPGGRSESKNMTMSGSKTQSFYSSVCVSGYPYIVAPTVPVTGTVTVTAQPSETGAAITGNGTLSGVATIWVTGNARLITYAYLPLIARQEQPTGGAWSDDFSSDKGWARLSASDVCDVGVDNGTLRVKLKKEGICWISAPSGVFLAQGTFQVEAMRTSDAKAWFSLIFNATTSLLDQRWQLDAAPWDSSDGCESGKARVKLSYKDGSAGGQSPICTNTLKRSKNEWNTLKVVRNGDNVKAYVNGDLKIEVNESRLKDAGLFDLAVWGTESDAVIRFDNFSITP